VLLPARNQGSATAGTIDRGNAPVEVIVMQPGDKMTF